MFKVGDKVLWLPRMTNKPSTVVKIWKQKIYIEGPNATPNHPYDYLEFVLIEEPNDILKNLVD